MRGALDQAAIAAVVERRGPAGAGAARRAALTGPARRAALRHFVACAQRAPRARPGRRAVSAEARSSTTRRRGGGARRPGRRRRRRRRAGPSPTPSAGQYVLEEAVAAGAGPAADGARPTRRARRSRARPAPDGARRARARDRRRRRPRRDAARRAGSRPRARACGSCTCTAATLAGGSLGARRGARRGGRFAAGRAGQRHRPLVVAREALTASPRPAAAGAALVDGAVAELVAAADDCRVGDCARARRPPRAAAGAAATRRARVARRAPPRGRRRRRAARGARAALGPPRAARRRASAGAPPRARPAAAKLASTGTTSGRRASSPAPRGRAVRVRLGRRGRRGTRLAPGSTGIAGRARRRGRLPPTRRAAAPRRGGRRGGWKRSATRACRSTSDARSRRRTPSGRRARGGPRSRRVRRHGAARLADLTSGARAASRRVSRAARRGARPAAAGEDCGLPRRAPRPVRGRRGAERHAPGRPRAAGGGGATPRPAPTRGSARLLERGPVAIQRLCEDAADLRDALQGSLPSYVRNCGRSPSRGAGTGARAWRRRGDRYAALQRVVEGRSRASAGRGLAPTAAHVEDVVGSRSKLGRFWRAARGAARGRWRTPTGTGTSRRPEPVLGLPVPRLAQPEARPVPDGRRGRRQRRAPGAGTTPWRRPWRWRAPNSCPRGTRAAASRARAVDAGATAARGRRPSARSTQPAGRAAVRQHQRRAARPRCRRLVDAARRRSFAAALGAAAGRSASSWAVVRPLRRGRRQLRGRLRRAAAVRGRRGTPAIGRRRRSRSPRRRSRALALAAAAPVAVAAWGYTGRAPARPPPRAAAGAGAARLRPAPRASPAPLAARAGPVAARLRPAGVHGRVGVLLQCGSAGRAWACTVRPARAHKILCSHMLDAGRCPSATSATRTTQCRPICGGRPREGR